MRSLGMDSRTHGSCAAFWLLSLVLVSLHASPAWASENAGAARLDSPVQSTSFADPPVVVRAVPHVGTSPFGIMEDPTDDTIWVSDLFSGGIHQYSKDLTFLQTVSPPVMSGTTTSGIAYDAGADTFWVYGAGAGTFFEIDKTGIATGNSVFFAPGGLVGPATIDPDSSPGTVWCEDIGLDVVFQVDLTSGSVLSSHANPGNTGSGAFGNGLSYDSHDPFSGPGDLIVSSGTLGEGQVTLLSRGNPSAGRAYQEAFDVSAISTFINGIQDSTDGTLRNSAVTYLVDNAGNRIVEIGPRPAILDCAPGAVNAGVPSAAIVDDMENGQQPFWSVSSEGLGTNDWAITSSGNAHSGTQVWFVADEATIADKYLVLETDIPSSDTVLEFFHTFSMESGFDGGVLEISTNGGTSFADLGPSFLEGGYNGTISTSFGNPIAGRDAWSGGALGPMTRVAVDLSAYAGQPDALVRWRHASDSSVGAIGWEIDDVAFSNPNSPCDGSDSAVVFVNREIPARDVVDDMESGQEPFWSVSAGIPAQQDWTIVSSSNARSPVHVWFAADEATLADKYLDLTISFPSDRPILEFWHTYQMENNFDGGVLEVSTDGGTTYVDLGGNAIEGGYDGTISACCGNPLSGRPAWSGGTLGAPTRVRVDVSILSGQTATLRWRHASDSSVSSVGWEIDDVAFSSGPGFEGTGGEDFTVTEFNACEPLAITIDEAPSRRGDGMPSDACFYVWFREPAETDIVSLPKDLGNMCFGTFSIATRPPRKIANSIGRTALLGESSFPFDGIPEGGDFTLANRPNGVGVPIDIFIQGVIQDDCSIGRVPFSVTNGVLAEVGVWVEPDLEDTLNQILEALPLTEKQLLRVRERLNMDNQTFLDEILEDFIDVEDLVNKAIGIHAGLTAEQVEAIRLAVRAGLVLANDALDDWAEANEELAQALDEQGIIGPPVASVGRAMRKTGEVVNEVGQTIREEVPIVGDALGKVVEVAGTTLRAIGTVLEWFGLSLDEEDEEE